MLCTVNPLNQTVGRIIIEHRDSLLTDDRAGIHAGVHKMHRATRHLYAVVQCLFPCFQTWKRRQQRWMNVHNAPFERAQEIALQYPHETGECHQINLRLLQGTHERALRLLVQFGAEFPRRNKSGRDRSFARMSQNSRAIDIAQNQCDVRRDLFRRTRLGQGDKIRAFAGAENADSKWIAHCDLNNRADPQNK